jgi:uncharacterized membrane protein
MGGPGVLDIVKEGTLYLAAGVEAGAALIIAVAALLAIARSLLLFVQRGSGPEGNPSPKERIRLGFAGWLALALEFELAADILRTAVAPTWNDIGQLAAIAALRTALNYFLQKELDRAGMRSEVIERR